MIRRLLVFAFLLLVPSFANAGPIHVYKVSGHVRKIGHFVNTHKELIAVDGLEFAAFSADAASTRYAEAHCPGCVETNIFLPGRPSGVQVWGVASGYSAAMFTVNGLTWHYAQKSDKQSRHLIWFFAVPVITGEAAFAIPTNVKAANFK